MLFCAALVLDQLVVSRKLHKETFKEFKILSWKMIYVYRFHHMSCILLLPWRLSYGIKGEFVPKRHLWCMSRIIHSEQNSILNLDIWEWLEREEVGTLSRNCFLRYFGHVETIISKYSRVHDKWNNIPNQECVLLNHLWFPPTFILHNQIWCHQ